MNDFLKRKEIKTGIYKIYPTITNEELTHLVEKVEYITKTKYGIEDPLDSIVSVYVFYEEIKSLARINLQKNNYLINYILCRPIKKEEFKELSLIKRLVTYLYYVGFTPNKDYYINLINDNIFLNKALSKVVSEYKEEIENGEVNLIPAGHNTLNLIILYANLKGINTIKSNKKLEKLNITPTLEYVSPNFNTKVSNEEIKSLIIGYKNGNDNCLDILYKLYYKIIFKVVQKYKSYGNIEDLIQEGSKALIEAINSYDLNSNTPLVFHIYNEVRDALTEYLPNFYQINIELRKIKISFQIRKAIKYLTDRNKDVTISNISKLTNLSTGQIKYYFNYLRNIELIGSIDSLSETDIINLKREEYYVIEDATNKDLLKEEASSMLNLLNPKQRLLIELRYGINMDFCLPIKVISSYIGMTTSNVYQVEALLQNKIEKSSYKSKLEPFIGSELGTKNYACKDYTLEMSPKTIKEMIEIKRQSIDKTLTFNSILKSINLLGFSYEDINRSLNSLKESDLSIITNPIETPELYRVCRVIINDLELNKKKCLKKVEI